MVFLPDYIERVYAGVLGKIIGVYLGRPFEGWWHDAIEEKLGEVNYYVHDKLGQPLIVTDDDISGTFAFLRALADHGNSRDITAEQIGKSWMNYLIEKKTVLWWGGMGESTEHTAYLRMKHGMRAPQSGSIATNGRTVAEQIGAQIFIDGWAMINPGDPQRAVEMARRAASVSHDGEAIYGAQVLTAMESMAFVESDINHLLDTGVSLIPHDSTIYRMIADLRNWYEIDCDWRKTYRRIVEQYGYRDYVGGCHMVPNHALIILGLLYGEGDFQKSLMICNTAGWDTDCNSGNLGCLMGIRNGLAGFDGAVDWRGPVADRLYIPTADGGRCVSDAVTETYQVVNMASAMAGQKPVSPKNGSRFHFNLPGALQGMQVDQSADCSPYVSLQNIPGHSKDGARTLDLTYSYVGNQMVARVYTPTFVPPQDQTMGGYGVIASPTLYPGQIIQMGVSADEQNVSPAQVRPYVEYYDYQDQPARLFGDACELAAGQSNTLRWQTPDPQLASPAGSFIFAVGLEIARPTMEASARDDHVYLDFIRWDGEPATTFKRPATVEPSGNKAHVWRDGWVSAMEVWEWWNPAYNLIQNDGRGMIITGTREWKNDRVTAKVSIALAKSAGIAIRVQGLTRFYALELTEEKTLRLFRAYEQDDDRVLAEVAFPWEIRQEYELRLEANGSHLKAWVDGKLLLEAEDTMLDCGGIAITVTEGRIMLNEVQVEGVAP